MPSVVFVAPYFLPTTVRFVDAVGELPGVRLGLVSVDGPEKLPAGVRARLAAHARVQDGLDAGQIAKATRTLAEQIGSPGRLLGALEDLQVPLAEVRERLGIEGMGVEAARNFRDKARMKTVLRAAGIPTAAHGLAEDEATALAFARDTGFPLVAKPPAGAGARNTHRLDSEADLRALLARSQPRPGAPMLLEEFITGSEQSFDTVSIRGTAVWHSITHYIPGPLEVVENPWIQWCVLLPREVDSPRYDDIRRAGTACLHALGMTTGLSHMEWFRRSRDGSVAVSEVGARPPGAQFTTLISYAHDFDLYKAWARLMVFEEFDAPRREYAAGIAFLRGQGKGRVRAIHGLEQASQELGGIVIESRLPRAGQAPSGTYEGEGYVIMRHPDTGLVERALRRLVSLIRVELG